MFILATMKRLFTHHLSALFLLVITIHFLPTQIIAQSVSDELFEEYAKASFPQLKELLGIPNDAHFPKEIEKNVKWCEQHFTKRGFTTSRLETPAAPLLLAERKVSGAAKTVLIYLQVDGQPVDANFWFQDKIWVKFSVGDKKSGKSQSADNFVKNFVTPLKFSRNYQPTFFPNKELVFHRTKFDWMPFSSH